MYPLSIAHLVSELRVGGLLEPGEQRLLHVVPVLVRVRDEGVEVFVLVNVLLVEEPP